MAYKLYVIARICPQFTHDKITIAYFLYVIFLQMEKCVEFFVVFLDPRGKTIVFFYR